MSDVPGLFDLSAPGRRADPHPHYHRMREIDPVLWNEDEREWIMTGYDACERVLRDPAFSSNPQHLTDARPESISDLRGTMLDVGTSILLFLDPPDHTRLRRLVGKAFTPRRVEELRPRIREIVDGLLDDAAEKGELDVVGELGYRLPVTVICELMGVPVEDQDLFGPWSSAASRLLDGDLAEDEAQSGLLGAMHLINYFNELFEERRREPRDDLVSALLAAEDQGDVLTESELRAITILLFVAGHETTMNLIGNGMLALLRNRDQLARLRDDPALAQPAIEELLRYDGPVHGTARIATEDLEVGGHHIAKGQQLIAVLAAANRDPARFDEPDVLDVGRADNHHLTFSHGIHYCLGASLARAEGQVAITSLVTRFPDLELVTEQPRYRDHFVLRGLTELRVSL